MNVFQTCEYPKQGVILSEINITRMNRIRDGQDGFNTIIKYWSSRSEEQCDDISRHGHKLMTRVLHSGIQVYTGEKTGDRCVHTSYNNLPSSWGSTTVAALNTAAEESVAESTVVTRIFVQTVDPE